jgi:SAM-dependent methyltransferase
MNYIWWRTQLRKLPELGSLARFGDFDQADSFMPFLTEALELPQAGRVLDLGCGQGSFSVRLAQWGYSVVGVEESEPVLEIARDAARHREVEVEFRKADLRSIPERSAFEGALILDFGTLSDVDNAQMMRAVAAALKAGGRVVFGTCNPYFWAREPRVEHRSLDGMDVISRFSFDFLAGTVVSRVRCVLPNGERKDLPVARYRAYTLPELRNLIAGIGLADLRIYGEVGGRPVPDRPLDSLRTPFFHCVALRPVTGESGEGI